MPIWRAISAIVTAPAPRSATIRSAWSSASSIVACRRVATRSMRLRLMGIALPTDRARCQGSKHHQPPRRAGWQDAVDTEASSSRRYRRLLEQLLGGHGPVPCARVGGPDGTGLGGRDV